MKSTPKQIKLDQIEVVKGFNCRRSLGDISGLVKSISEDGITDYIEVKRNGKDSYVAVTGHRRLAAAKELGLEKVPCQVYDGGTDVVFLKLRNLQENIVRADLNPMDEAWRLEELIKEGVPKDRILNSLGWTSNLFTTRMNMVKYSDLVQEAIATNRIGIQQASVIDGDLPPEEHAEWIKKAESLTAAKLRSEVASHLMSGEMSPDSSEDTDDGGFTFEEGSGKTAPKKIDPMEVLEKEDTSRESKDIQHRDSPLPEDDDDDYFFGDDDDEVDGEMGEIIAVEENIKKHLSDMIHCYVKNPDEVETCIDGVSAVDFSTLEWDDLKVFEGVLRTLSISTESVDMSVSAENADEEESEEEFELG
jgi:ParB family chromosome partitioning protein